MEVLVTVTTDARRVEPGASTTLHATVERDFRFAHASWSVCLTREEREEATRCLIVSRVSAIDFGLLRIEVFVKNVERV